MSQHDPTHDKVHVTLNCGSVEYSRENAAVSIDQLIEMLEQAREDGATHVLGLSGNYRGAQYVHIPSTLGWDEDGEW